MWGRLSSWTWNDGVYGPLKNKNPPKYLIKLSFGDGHVRDESREEEENCDEEAEERAPNGVSAQREHDDVGDASEDAAEGLSGKYTAHVHRGKASGNSQQAT